MKEATQQRILVVEDNDPLREVIRDMLEAEGYVVYVASDGVEALEVMEQTRPDLIVSDIAMPRMDGYALYESIRTRSEWVRVPFIFLTARGQKEDMLRGKSMGVEDYLVKPFDPEELAIAVRSRLQRARAVQNATEAEFAELKRQISTILGHELRTPLTHIIGFTDLAMDDVTTLAPETLQEFLGAIKQGANRLAKLVEDLLLLVQIDTGRMAMAFDQVMWEHPDIGVLIESVVRGFEGRAATRGVKIDTALTKGLPPVKVHEPYFIDSLGRLVDNAIKFTRGTGKRVLVTARHIDGWIEVAVIDEGVGVSAEGLPHLFERFRQIDRERLEQQGVGIGLAISQELIRMHGGEITVQSAVDQGSAFTIRLPAVT